MKILADTGVWIAYFRNSVGASGFEELLTNHAVLVHPWIYGELSLGSISPKTGAALRELLLISSLPVSETDELLAFIGDYGLAKSGLGLVDAELLHSCLVSGNALWTLDRRLHREASRIGVDFKP